jgi:acyl transferase domain-containing protein/thioesterase domain-containing protein/NADPH-dependent curcumin reductase CurA/NAD(P)-dependent dehydrogenase (short-subunit alcohol dehydrogenase family)/acyl carrier protein
MQPKPDTPAGYDIAVIGVAGRFPGARNVAQYWRNLCAGVESVKFFSDDELLARGVPADTLRDPSYVRAQPVLQEFDRFDAGFFGFSPQDAAIMDPQHRVFLEVGWEALEDAGHDPETFAGNVGVFATCGMNTYMMYHLVRNRGIMDEVGEWLVRHTGNDMNFLATRLSYELNLRGPSMNVQTACSSALVAIHQACVSLLSGECDLALAGGATIALPQNHGYLYKPNEILSPDGHCRPFDARARGTLFGSGAGVVVLRRLADALEAGDRVLAVVKGSAVNNDGCGKVGYLAPSVDGQSRAVVEALTVSGIDPETVGYVEAHGTGTIVGDPIEMVALTQAYRQFTAKKGFCALGSVKSNIGHLGEAAGVAAFIKTVLALGHGQIPPSLHYEAPNPQIDFAGSPFFVNARLAAWPARAEPRRAGITSLGAGGTNCHVIVEESPPAPPTGPARPWQLLLLSAATPTALDAAAANLAAHLRERPQADLADVAFTLHAGRKAFAHRRAFVCRDAAEAAAALASGQGAIPSAAKVQERTVAFLFPGQGAQYPGMTRGLYESEPVFRAEFDRCAAILKAQHDLDIREVVFSPRPHEEARAALNQTAATQPTLFVVEYALARLWMSWGVQPAAMLGHSIGEYVAACLAGVFSLPDALGLVAERGRCMQQASPGTMLAVPLPAAEVERLVARPGSRLDLAVVNGPTQSVIGGPENAVAALQAELAARGVQCQRLQTSHAFHSALMEPVLAAFADRVRRVALHPPTVPYLANLTGTWARPEDAIDPNYWVRHLRHTVRFSNCLAALTADPGRVLLEVGPGRILSSLARQQCPGVTAVASLGRAGDEARDVELFLRACGQLWVTGCKVEAAGLYAGQGRRRAALPTYPFERQRFWVEPDAAAVASAPPPAAANMERNNDIEDWFYLPSWKRAVPPPARPADGHADWLVFQDEAGLGRDLVEQLRRQGPAAVGPCALEVGTPGDVDSLTVRPAERREPGPGEVEIRVRAAALNFADVLKAAGVFADAPFGMECAGVIERVGAGVTELCPGDEVVAIGPDSFRSHVTRDARLVAPKPAFLSLEEAATLPAAFMTVWYSLEHVARLRRGERVLIHAASGGVGLAAVQVARLAGAEIYATAGSKEKRAFLEGLGIRHVFESRSLAFADEVLARTGGAGVDVVLNSLTGEFIPKSFAVLAEGGRFLELGKREIYSQAQLAAMPLRPGVSYHAINLTDMLRQDPGAYGRLLREVVELARERRIQALARHDFAFVQAAVAFRLMLQTRHIGKVVLSLAPTEAQVFSVHPGAAFRQTDRHEFTVRPDEPADYAALLEALQQGAARVGHVAHLWNVAAKAGDEPLEPTLQRGFFSLIALAKAFGSRDWTQPLDVAVLATGLHPLAGETDGQPAKATLAGPCRVIPREFANVSCRTVDVPLTAPGSWQRARLVRQLATEVAGNAGEPAVAYRNADRWVLGLEPARLPAPAAGVSLRPGGVYLITGGLGGLGLEVAGHLARTVRAKLILVGRRRLPPPAQWGRPQADPALAEILGKLRACEEAGATVVPVAADVTDRAAMLAVVTETRRRFGGLHGVIHAAGALDDGLVLLKTPEAARGVLAPKVEGTLALDEVLGEEPLDFFALFSSLSTVLGLQGQVDYTAANAFLDAFAARRSARRPGQTVALNWTAWQEVGMAARSANPWAPRPASAGAGRPRHPWLERRLDSGTEIRFVTDFRRAGHWVLGEHAIRGGAALIPGTGFLELARAALTEVAEAPAVEISRVVFQAPFALRNGGSKELTFALQPAQPGWDFCVSSNGGGVTHVTGHVAPTAPPAARRLNVPGLQAACNARTEVLDGFLRQSFMDFGPRWGNVREIRFGDREAVLALELAPAFAADLSTIQLHPALLDMATGGAQPLIPGFDPARDFYVPFSYGRLVLRQGFTRKLFSHVRLRDAAARGLATFDVTIADENGIVAAEISEFVMKRVSQLATDLPDEDAAAAPAATLAGQILRLGIGPADGLEAFGRVLAAGVAPQVVVSPVHPQRWLELIAAPPAAKEAVPATAAAPVADTVGDGDPVEERLKALYRQILGVQQVGPRDDFFELGGHSLLAVRLLTRIEKDFKKAIPLAELFRAPTVEHLAGILRGTEAPKRKVFNVIVPLNDKGSGRALYFVHSLGGEVASFRHLARHLGGDWRLYGVQVPPDRQNAGFATSIEAMAKHYVEALVAFQPEGPYLLGGWSAGSTLALEMAHQLVASGRQVDLLVALDGAPFVRGVSTSLWNPIYYWKLARNFPRWVADDLLYRFSFPAFVRRVRNKIVALARRAAGALRGGQSRVDVASFLDTSHYSANLAGFMNALFAALNAYQPKEYPGRVLLYKARTQPLYHLLEVERAWRRAAAQLEVVEVRGTHISLATEPYVADIARHLRVRLNEFSPRSTEP